MKNDEFETPQWLFDQLNEEFNFDLDVAATLNNSKCNDYYVEDTDGHDGLFNGLYASWSKYPYYEDGIIKFRSKNSVFMNPPYSRGQLEKWCKKAYEESLKGVTVVGLLPVDTSTKWFHEWIWSKKCYYEFVKRENLFSYRNGYVKDIEIRFLDKRIAFELNGQPQRDKKGNIIRAMFASMIVIWRGTNNA